MCIATIIPDDRPGVRYVSRAAPKLSIQVLVVKDRSGWGQSFPEKVIGLRSDGRLEVQPIHRFWDEWIHEDLVTDERTP